MDKLPLFSIKDGWVELEDFVLARLLHSDTGEASEEKTYIDCLFEYGYQEVPTIELGDPKGIGLEVYLNANTQNQLPKYFITYYMSDRDQSRYVVCNDHISLMELLAKLTPTIHLALTTDRLFKTV